MVYSVGPGNVAGAGPVTEVVQGPKEFKFYSQTYAAKSRRIVAEIARNGQIPTPISPRSREEEKGIVEWNLALLRTPSSPGACRTALPKFQITIRVNITFRCSERELAV